MFGALTDRPALVASDLDGTLLRTDGTASLRTVRAVRALQDAGVPWVVVTARPPRWMHGLEHLVGDGGLAICSNGAYVYDVAGRRVVSQRALAIEVLHELVDRLRARIPGIAFAVENSGGFGREPGYLDSAHVEPPDTVVADVHELLDPLPGKFLARAAGLPPDQFLSRVTDVVGARAVVSYSGASGLAEISAAGVTKATVLAEYSADLGIAPEDVWAFGDMPNDVPMLEWVGRSFAVANAHVDVRRVADHVCPANDDDGVARILEEMLANLSEPGAPIAD